MRNRSRLGIAGVVLLLMLAGAGFAEVFHVIPYDVDPPIEVDGDLSDWQQVANPLALASEKHVTYGRDTWTDAADLSGTIRMAWRTGLYVAAEVTDDVVLQPYTGMDIYNGDHVNVWVDFTPNVEPERRSFGVGQYHFVLSPGNLATAEGNGPVTRPEVFFYVPENMPAPGCKIAARRTETGYVLEAFVPFTLLKGRKVEQGVDVNFEVAISDADALPARQEAFMTWQTKPWVYSRQRLMPMVFGDGNGKGSLPPRSFTLLKEATIPTQKSHVLEFDAPEIPKDKAPFLFLKGRVDYRQVAGYFPTALKIKLNGNVIEGDRISNRPRRGVMMRGDDDEYIHEDGGLALWYSPNFTATEEHPQYKLVDNIKACEFEFNLAGLLKPGKNVLEFQCTTQATPESPRTVVIGDVALRVKAAVAQASLKAAPTGPIATYEPLAQFSKRHSELHSGQSEMAFTVGGRRVRVSSRFSTPDGKWTTGPNRYFDFQREVVERGEWIEVQDTFTNRTDEKLPLMMTHTARVSGVPMTQLWLGGVRIPSGEGTKSTPGNPTVVGATDDVAVGLIALNDAFKCHVAESGRDGGVELADRSLALGPHGTYVARWAVAPMDTPDFWQFINAARRMLDVNFTVDMMFAFMAGEEPVYKWTDKMFQNYVRNKSANFVVQSIYGPSAARYKGRNAYSTSFLVIDHAYYRDFHKRLRRFFSPEDVRHGIYYHCFIDNYDGNDVRFAADRVTNSVGEHVNYGGNYTYDKIYVPTLENEFGKETEKVITKILDDIGADGIFWDEFRYSRVPYTYSMWDGCSAEIDPKTHTLLRTKGHLSLLSAPWRAKQVKRIMAHGPLLCSGAPVTEAMAKLKWYGFCETGSVTSCRGMLLWTPIGLGDHITEKTQVDAYRQMLRQMDHGCLYAWYSTRIMATHKTLTEYMYPFTPIELHSGVLIGKERILANRSGYFGWGDASRFEAHVFDRDGRETKALDIPRVIRGGKAYGEVRIPEGFSVALVRMLEK